MHRRQPDTVQMTTGSWWNSQNVWRKQESYWSNQMQNSTTEFLGWWDYQEHKKMKRWVEHYSELYSRKICISNDVLEHLEYAETVAHLSVMEGPNTLPTGKWSRAIYKWHQDRMVFHQRQRVECHHMVSLLCQCLEESMVPQNMRDRNIVTIYKNKGNYASEHLQRNLPAEHHQEGLCPCGHR